MQFFVAFHYFKTVSSCWPYLCNGKRYRFKLEMYRFRKWIRTRAITFSFKIACENISFSSLLAAGDVSRFTRRFLRAKRPKWRTARRNECFRRLHSKQIYMKLFNIHFPLFYFNIIRNRLRMIMHRHTKKKTRRKRNTEEVKIEPHRIPQNS